MTQAQLEADRENLQPSVYTSIVHRIDELATFDEDPAFHGPIVFLEDSDPLDDLTAFGVSKEQRGLYGPAIDGVHLYDNGLVWMATFLVGVGKSGTGSGVDVFVHDTHPAMNEAVRQNLLAIYRKAGGR
jgi:hypothetical protein